jgi:hypothetical protein
MTIVRLAPGRLGAACLALLLAAGGVPAGASPAAQASEDVTLEYRVKAAYLFNFTKFIEWPDAAVPPGAPITICVAGDSPFGAALDEIIRGEAVNGRPLAARRAEPPAGCHVVFVPRGTSPAAALRPFRSLPVLTVGESDDFLRQGGMVNFVIDDGKVRFEIDHEAAERAHVRISSRLLRLARATEPPQEGR